MDVGEICTREVVTVTAEATIVEAARLMREHHVGNVVVVERGGRSPRPVGILTDRDIVVSVVAVTPDLVPRLLVEEVMSVDPVLARVGETVEDVIGKMRKEGVRRLPVVNAEDQLVGIVSFDDLTEYLAGVMSRLVENIDTEMWLEERRR